MPGEICPAPTRGRVGTFGEHPPPCLRQEYRRIATRDMRLYTGSSVGATGAMRLEQDKPGREPGMHRRQRPKNLAGLLEQQRQQLRARLDVSPKLRQLSRAAVPQSLLPDRMRRSPAVRTAVVIAVVALLAACVLGATALAASGLWLQDKLSDPATASQNFYGALHQQDYGRAYADLSAGAHQRTTQAAFVAQYSELDAIAGVVESYSITSRTTSAGTATVVASIVRRGDTTRAQAQTLALVKENGGWHIDQITVGGFAPVSG